MKYKLIKSYPGSAPVGEIYQGESLSENFPEFFAPFLFTTEDGVDIYHGDTYWLKCEDNRIVKEEPPRHEYDLTAYEDGAILKGQKTFSTKEAAEKYLESLKSEFKAGQWVYVIHNGSHYSTHPEMGEQLKDDEIYYLKGVTNALHPYINRAYRIDRVTSFSNDSKVIVLKENNRVYPLGVSKEYAQYFRPATTEEIKKALIKEAKKRGFKEGVKFYPVDSTTAEVTKDFTYQVDAYSPIYYPREDVLCWNGNIYCKGTWAEIISEPLQIGDYKITFPVKNQVSIGCQSYSLESVKALELSMKTFGITSLEIKEYDVSYDLVQRVLQRMEE